MGRSVYVPSGAELTFYFPFETEEDDGDWLWDDLLSNLRAELSAVDSSFDESRRRYGGEGTAILENSLCDVVLSEYCGLASLSFVPKDECDDDSIWEPLKDRWEDFARERLASKKAEFEKALIASGCELYAKQGTFSNGESVYMKVV